MSDVPPPRPPPLSYDAPPLPVPVMPVDAATTSIAAQDVPRHLAAAHLAWRPIRRAVRYATFDAWTLAVCAALSVPCLVGGAAGVLVAVVLAGVAAVEFRGVSRLRRLDPAAPRMLAINQLALAGIILLYAAWNLYLTRTDRGLMRVLIDQGIGQGGPEMVAEARRLVELMYGILALVGPATTVAAAWFYASRGRRLRAYLAATPPWVLQMHRERGSL